LITKTFLQLFQITKILIIFNEVLSNVFSSNSPPEIGYVSSDQDVCEGSLVTLSCNATGKPTPNITWTRVADGVQLPAVDGNYVMSNIQRSSNGTYRCTADNGAGDPVNRTVQVRVRCEYMMLLS